MNCEYASGASCSSTLCKVSNRMMTPMSSPGMRKSDTRSVGLNSSPDGVLI